MENARRKKKTEEDNAKMTATMEIHDSDAHGGHGHHKEGWRGTLLSFLHSTSAEKFLMMLLIFDCMFVISIMVMDAQYYNGKANDIKDHLKQCRKYGFDVCEPGGDQPDYGSKTLYSWEKNLHWGSVAILVVFAIDVTLTVIAMGFDYFNTENWPFWLDFVVVWASLLVDLLTTNVSLGFLIFVRLWRIVRVVHGQHTLEEKEKQRKLKKVRSESMRSMQSESADTSGGHMPKD